MQGVPGQPQRTPAEWTGGPALMEKWLARLCAVESIINVAGGAMLLMLGLIALIITSCLAAGVILIIVIEADGVLALGGISGPPVRAILFSALFLLFLGFSLVHAYKTRWGTDAAVDLDLRTVFSSYKTLGWEILSAGPILLILSGQEFHRYLRLARLDVRQVGALLLWLYDKGKRATFAEICVAFPDLNVVRVLPQLRDVPGVNWWPEDAAVSLSENLRQTFAKILGRDPKSSTASDRSPREGQPFQEPGAAVDREVLAWYAALHLPLFAPLQQVKSQYRKLAKIHHPDARSGNRAAGAEPPNDEQMKRINEAYHSILEHSQKHPTAP